jgi:hypothetical protein
MGKDVVRIMCVRMRIQRVHEGIMTLHVRTRRLVDAAESFHVRSGIGRVRIGMITMGTTSLREATTRIRPASAGDVLAGVRRPARP